MSLQSAQKPSPISNLARIKVLEKEIRMLKEKVKELSTENTTLREINVKFQIENFNLQKKLTQLESSHEVDEILYEEDQSPVIEEEEIDEARAVLRDDAQKGGETEEELYEEILYENDAELETAEYLDEDAYETEEKRKEPREKEAATRRRYSDAFECIEEIHDTSSLPPKKKSKQKDDDIEYEITIIDDEDDITDDYRSITEPKDAIIYIYKLASRKASLHKLKSVGKGKQKDSAFVSKVLDLIFDRLTLASSSAQGQKCQSKLHLPAKPALDQDKLELCKKAFVYRLKTEDVAQDEKQMRLKSFLKLVNDKIQNCRKCVSRSDPKMLEI